MQTALGWTALFLAVKEGKTDVAETLLQNGADPTLKDAVSSRNKCAAIAIYSNY